jgi:hypothetical protein
MKNIFIISSLNAAIYAVVFVLLFLIEGFSPLMVCRYVTNIQGKSWSSGLEKQSISGPEKLGVFTSFIGENESYSAVTFKGKTAEGPFYTWGKDGKIIIFGNSGYSTPGFRVIINRENGTMTFNLLENGENIKTEKKYKIIEHSDAQ